MTKDVMITILTRSRFDPFAYLFMTAVEVGVIGIGIALDSVGLQLLGVAALIFLAAGGASRLRAKNSDLTIDQAFVRLSQIQREADN
ncbi:hypothetical protein [Ketogulonicigenium vulgare]|uniref:hypothetical protein n=1 Tax=Ketogulonicigenium vulgare TaxID=92945 RepID=UPI0023585C85|nr:hypothetical protein [Ketogulonicigenium vulgare]